MRTLLLLALTLCATRAAAPARLPKGLPVLFVTHAGLDQQWPPGATRPAGSEYRTAMFAKKGLDASIAAFKARGWPVVYLHGMEGEDFVPSDRDPSLSIVSKGGWHDFALTTGEVYVAGGELTGCAWNTVRASAASAFAWQAAHAGEARPSLHVHLVTDALFGPSVWTRAGRPRLGTFARRLAALKGLPLLAAAVELDEGGQREATLHAPDKASDPLLAVDFVSSGDIARGPSR